MNSKVVASSARRRLLTCDEEGWRKGSYPSLPDGFFLWILFILRAPVVTLDRLLDFESGTPVTSHLLLSRRDVTASCHLLVSAQRSGCLTLARGAVSGLIMWINQRAALWSGLGRGLEIVLPRWWCVLPDLLPNVTFSHFQDGRHREFVWHSSSASSLRVDSFLISSWHAQWRLGDTFTTNCLSSPGLACQSDVTTFGIFCLQITACYKFLQRTATEKVSLVGCGVVFCIFSVSTNFTKKTRVSDIMMLISDFCKFSRWVCVVIKGPFRWLRDKIRKIVKLTQFSCGCQKKLRSFRSLEFFWPT